MVFIITALSAPSFRVEEERYLTPEKIIFLYSMFLPACPLQMWTGKRRIDAARDIISGFRKTRGNDYPGLILFSDVAFLSAPPSPDFRWFDNTLENADIVYPDRGTAIGDAAALAVFYLRKSLSDDKIGIIISDGVNNTGRISPHTAAEAAAENGIRLYTVSVGSDSQAQTDEGENVLKMIAEKSGALYFNGKDMKEMEYAFSFIGNMEERERHVEKIVRLERFSTVFIAAALICLLISVFVRQAVLREINP